MTAPIFRKSQEWKGDGKDRNESRFVTAIDGNMVTYLDAYGTPKTTRLSYFRAWVEQSHAQVVAGPSCDPEEAPEEAKEPGRRGDGPPYFDDEDDERLDAFEPDDEEPDDGEPLTELPPVKTKTSIPGPGTDTESASSQIPAFIRNLAKS